MIVYPPKPERTHHCRTCNACILKYDHHCPWLNQCVGLGNERYFILFMLWFSLGAFIFAISGWPIAYNALVNKIWISTVFPRILYLALYAKAIVMGPAVFILALWHLYLAARNETSVESQDHSHYQKTPRSETRYSRACTIWDGFATCKYFSMWALAWQPATIPFSSQCMSSPIQTDGIGPNALVLEDNTLVL